MVGGGADGPGGAGVIFRNINIEDPRPTLQQFFLCMTVPPPYSKSTEAATGDLSGILFQNISIAAPSVLGEPQILWGQADARIRNLVFENLTLAGQLVRDSHRSVLQVQNVTNSGNKLMVGQAGGGQAWR